MSHLAKAAAAKAKQTVSGFASPTEQAWTLFRSWLAQRCGSSHLSALDCALYCAPLGTVHALLSLLVHPATLPPLPSSVQPLDVGSVCQALDSSASQEPPLTSLVHFSAETDPLVRGVHDEAPLVLNSCLILSSQEAWPPPATVDVQELDSPLNQRLAISAADGNLDAVRSAGSTRS